MAINYIINYIKKKIIDIEDPKNRLEVLLVTATIFFVYLYIYTFQNMLRINVEFIGIDALIKIPVISILVFPLIWLLVRTDPLQRSPSKRKEIRFFQNEFPSNYILDRCESCIEDENSCKNFIKPESYAHIRHWFQDIFHGELEKENPGIINNTFRKGYTCKLFYYLKWVLVIITTVAILTALIHHIVLALTVDVKFDVTAQQILFIVGIAIIILIIKGLNNPDVKSPSGCWQAWREINRMHISWMKDHDSLLVDIICHKNQGTKQFIPK